MFSREANAVMAVRKRARRERFFSPPFIQTKPVTYNRSLIMFFCLPTGLNGDITSASATFMLIALA